MILIFASNAQEAEETNDNKQEYIKLTKEERKEKRREAEQRYVEWERKYFNSPGKWYMALEAGYGFPFLTTEPEAVPPLLFIGNSFLEEKPDGSRFNKLLLSGQGGGHRIGLTVGKMFTRFVGFEVKMGYFKAVTDNLSTVNQPKFNAVLDTRLSELSISPSLVLRSPNMRNFYLIGKIGPYIPQWGNPRARAFIDDRDGSFLTGVLDDPLINSVLGVALENDVVQDILELANFRTIVKADVEISLQQDFSEYKLNEILRGIGVNASFGFRYQATPIVSVYGDINVKGYNISLARVLIDDLTVKTTVLGGTELISLTEDGGSILGIDVEKKQLKALLETRYVNELTNGSNNPAYVEELNNFNPREELAPRLSVVALSFNVGLQFNFPGKGVYYRENSRKAQKAKALM